MTFRLGLVFTAALLLMATFNSAASAAEQSCNSITSLTLPHTTITLAAAVPPGTVPEGIPPDVASLKLSFCQVTGVIKPTPDSDIKFELWLPATGWNGKFLQIGNGGFAGSIPRLGLIQPLLGGYATAATDDGHVGAVTEARWAIGHPERVIDFGYRAVHELSIVAKMIIHAFYDKEPHHSYFTGCSDGGREAMMEAQRFPEDFDGIVSGAPANYWTSLMISAVWNEQALRIDPASYIPASKLQALQEAALSACDALDGVKDGVIEDPRRCHFDPATILCKEADQPSCLTAPQVEAAKKIYSGPKNPHTKQQIAPGISPGVEAAAGTWAPWIVGTEPGKPALLDLFVSAFFGDMVFGDANWDFHKFDFDRDVTTTAAKFDRLLSATNPDLDSFRTHGGKLIQYHGWGDPAIAPLLSIQYYESVVVARQRTSHQNPLEALKETQKFYRLFMVPGMGHCGGGSGPNNFGNSLSSSSDPAHNIVSALNRWVEAGVAPEQLIATKYQGDDAGKNVIRTRPLCPYPQVAEWKGSGSTDDSTNFVCHSRIAYTTKIK